MHDSDDSESESSRKDKKKHKHRHKHKHKHSGSSAEKSSRDRSHKHKKKKHHKRDASDAEDGATKAKRSKTSEDEELDKLERARAQLRAELNGSTTDGSAMKAINLIAEGYGSESEEEGEIDHDEHQEQLRRAREILEGIKKDLPSQVSEVNTDKHSEGGDYEKQQNSHSDHSEEVIDVDDEFDARNYRTVVLAERVTEQLEEESAVKERDDGSDVEIIEELTEGPTPGLEIISERRQEKTSSTREGDRRHRKADRQSRKSPHRSVLSYI